MKKKINLENGDKILIASYPVTSGMIFRIYKGYFKNEEIEKYLLLSTFEGYLFEGIISDTVEACKIDSLDFDLKKDDPLYKHFSNLLDQDDIMVICDDNIYEERKKTLSIYKSEDDIILSFVNRLERQDVMNKFIFYIDSDYNRVDCNSKEIKFRLKNFFNGLKDEFLNNEFIPDAKQKIYKK